MTEGGAINTTGDQFVPASRDTPASGSAGSNPSDGAINRVVLPMIPICGEFPIRIARDGTWFYHGSPIGRKPLVKLFARVLARQPDGAYWLVTPYERGAIVVDDAPFVAVLCDATGTGQAQRLRFTTNLEEEVTAGPEHPIIMRGSVDAPAPYVTVRPGLEARLARSVFYQLADLACERQSAGRIVTGVWSDGVFFALEPTGYDPA